MGYGQQYFRQTVFTLFTTLLGGVLFYLLRIVLYRELTDAGQQDAYGLFYAVFSFAMVLQPLLSIGFDPGMVPYITRAREQDDWAGIKTLVFGALVPQVLLAGTAIVFAWIFAQSLAQYCIGDPDAAVLIRLVALHAACLVLYKSGLALLLGMQHIAAKNLSELLRVVACLVVAVTLLKLGYGAAAAAWAYVAGAIAGILVQLLAAGFQMPKVWRAPFTWQPQRIREVFHSGKHLTIAMGGVTIFSHMDTVMLTLLQRDLTAVTAYQLALPTVMILYALLIAVATNFMPMVTTLWFRDQHELLADGVQRIYEAMIALVVPAAVLMACFSDVLMGTMFGRDVLSAPAAFNILAVGSIAYFTCYLNLQILAGLGETTAASKSIAWALALNLVLNVVLIVPFGIVGAACATALSHLVATALSLREIRRRCLIKIGLLRVSSPMMLALGLAAGCMQLRQTMFFEENPITVSLVAASFLYVVAMAVLELSGLTRLRALVEVVLGHSSRASNESNHP
jgi:O-antigen/teichoic acid export membrane protein